MFCFWCCISARWSLLSTYFLTNGGHFPFWLIIQFASIRTDPPLYYLHGGYRFAFHFRATVHMCDSGNASHHRCCPSLPIAFRPPCPNDGLRVASHFNTTVRILSSLNHSPLLPLVATSAQRYKCCVAFPHNGSHVRLCRPKPCVS